MNEDQKATRRACACAAPLEHASRQRPAVDGRTGPARRRRRAGRPCNLFGTLVLDGKRVPVGPCWVHQSAGRTVLSWTEADGSEKVRDISGPVLRQLLDEGLLRTRDG